MEQDNEAEVSYQEQTNKPKEKPIWPWIVGGIVILVVVLIGVFFYKKFKN